MPRVGHEDHVIARWRAWLAVRRHERRVNLWLWHKYHEPGPCDCKKRIEKLTPRSGRG